MAKLSDPITFLQGIGPKKAKLFEKLGIYTLQDLICHFPRAYEDRTRVGKIGDLELDTNGSFRATVIHTGKSQHVRKGLDIVRVTVSDGLRRLPLIFFNQNYSADVLKYGQRFVFYGMLRQDRGGQCMINPIYEQEDTPPVQTRRILPVYPLTAGLTNNAMAKAIAQAMAVCDAPAEILPADVRKAYGIMDASRAYTAIHAPNSWEEVEQAKRRLVFEEFFIFSAGLSLLRAKRAAKGVAPYKHTYLDPFYKALPFTLTNAQDRAIQEIIADLQAGKPMNRLVQGDVGSGKTMVAAAAAWLAFLNHKQCAVMAPTEILAEQHFFSLGKLLEPLGVRVCLLTGSMKAKEKRIFREAIAQGQIDLVIGTHAIVSEDTEFKNLDMVIADEQHRFGVAQRAALSQKGKDPHVLVMSATPIPRTLSLIMYGDLDVSILDELPPGRQSVDTFLVDESYRPRLNSFIRKHVDGGNQVFVVCPAVELEEGQSMKAVEEWAKTLQKTVFPDYKVALLHGQMRGSEKEGVMRAFANKQADILVATTVVEVGVDVPNATLMVIEDADRFGLSQLHQLRGRVGRGKDKSYCVLFSQNQNPQTRSRMKAFCKTNDGFQIAEEDLRLRGPGDFFGARQSGLPAFRVANLSCDLETLKQAQQASKDWIEKLGTAQTAESQAMRLRIAQLFARNEGAMN